MSSRIKRFLPTAALLFVVLATPPAVAEEVLDLDAHVGKIVYVDFWASWCVPCRASFPWMNALQAELGDEGLVVIGVNTGDSPEAAAAFLEVVPADFSIVTDTDGSLARAHGLQGMPMAYVYGRNAELLASHIGFNKRSSDARAEEIRQWVRAAE